jgi:hypothetical protein
MAGRTGRPQTAAFCCSAEVRQVQSKPAGVEVGAQFCISRGGPKTNLSSLKSVAHHVRTVAGVATLIPRSARRARRANRTVAREMP